MRIRVLEVIPTLKRAGAENVVAALARRLDRGRFELKVASLYGRFAEGWNWTCQCGIWESGAGWTCGWRRG